MTYYEDGKILLKFGLILRDPLVDILRPFLPIVESQICQDLGSDHQIGAILGIHFYTKGITTDPIPNKEKSLFFFSTAYLVSHTCRDARLWDRDN